MYKGKGTYTLRRGVWLSTTAMLCGSGTRGDLIVSCFLEVLVAPPNKQNHVQTSTGQGYAAAQEQIRGLS